MLFCASVRETGNRAALWQWGRKKQHPVTVITFFFNYFLKFIFIFFCLACFAVRTLRYFMRAVFDLRGSVCLRAAGASAPPRGRDNLGFA